MLPEHPPLAVRRAAAPPRQAQLEGLDALLVVVPAAEAVRRLTDLPHGSLLVAEHQRRARSPGSCYALSLPSRRRLRVVVGVLDARAEPFAMLTLAGRMLREIAAAEPARLGLAELLNAAASATLAPLEALLAAVSAATEPQPSAKSRPPRLWRPERLVLFGRADVRGTLAVEAGALLARWLTALPPNVLDPGAYRRALRVLARRQRWRIREYGEAALRRLGAGAFLAVSRGSARRDAALVHLAYRPPGRRGRALAPIALVGKGLCFDTGGHNLKSAKSMLDMHIDMGGSAVALGILTALTELKYPRPVDCWLAIAENRLSPEAYTQQDVVTAANGTSIQVTHTDAEGRMVLADALALASRARPSCIVDFATLTGACVYALTERFSGVFTNRDALRPLLEAAGARSGERVWGFPQPADFDEDLETRVADVVQCLLDGKGDHIYAARFLSRFVGAGIPWVHVDLSSAQRVGGLAHVSNPITGFGVRFGATLLQDAPFLAAIGRRRGRAP